MKQSGGSSSGVDGWEFAHTLFTQRRGCHLGVTGCGATDCSGLQQFVPVRQGRRETLRRLLGLQSCFICGLSIWEFRCGICCFQVCGVCKEKNAGGRCITCLE
eukprot:2630276-Rhodomonas_salina.1